MRIEPANAEWRYGLGDALARRGRIDEAVREFETALRLDPAHEDARRALDELAGRRSRRDGR